MPFTDTDSRLLFNVLDARIESCKRCLKLEKSFETAIRVSRPLFEFRYQLRQRQTSFDDFIPMSNVKSRKTQSLWFNKKPIVLLTNQKDYWPDIIYNFLVMLSLGLPMENEVFVLRSGTTENGKHLVSEENIINGKKYNPQTGISCNWFLQVCFGGLFRLRLTGWIKRCRLLLYIFLAR